jgi:hypothetical protein
MTHKFAEYLQREFPDWNVDCEYNRDGDIPKRLLNLFQDDRVRPSDDNAATVFPDIIVHHRGQRGEQANLLVLEAKKSGASDELDKFKLEEFMNDHQYNYCHAVLLRFVTGRSPEIIIKHHP